MEQFHQTSRAKAIAAGNEEASTTINLGEFQEVDTLTLSEAALVINALVSKRRNDRKNINETEYACAASLSTSSGPPVYTAEISLFSNMRSSFCVLRGVLS
jgi:hypothetical protein